MMNLSSTNEEMEALKYFLAEGNKVMNQLLVSNAETDIALLNSDDENETLSISYNRDEMISYLMKIKALYTLILKQYYTNNRRTTEFFVGTELAEVERVKNEPFIDKFLSATKTQKAAENSFAQNCNKLACIKIKLDSNVPYLTVKDVLGNDIDEVIIAPFTRVRSCELSKEKELDNKAIRVYNIELEKQQLEELKDRERFGLYNIILDNAYLVERKLQECIKLDKENEKNYENIRKLEQLLIKYENSVEDKETDEDDSNLSGETDYNNIERITIELDELKKTATSVFEERRSNINFINTWKRNIAVYMLSECNEIEKKFADLEVPEQIVENVEDENVIEESSAQEETTEESPIDSESESEENDSYTVEQNDDDIAEENSATEEVKNSMEENSGIVTDVADEKNNVEKKDNLENSDKTLENESHETVVVMAETEYDDSEETNSTFKRVRNESRENIEASEKLINDIKNLITKQQNHARIAGSIGSNYSALNNAFEMKSIAENLLELLKKIDAKVQEAGKEDNEEKLESISKINIEISTLMNYLNNPKIALKNTSVTRFEEMAIIEENELKRGIAEKIRDIRGEAELKKLKDDLEIIEDKTSLTKIIGFFTGQNKLDEFIIEQIDLRQRAIRKNLSKKLNLAYNYSVHELVAEIEMFIEDNEDDFLVEKDVEHLKELAEELRRNYIISEAKVNSIIKKKSGKNLPVDTRKVSRYEIIEIETYRFLNKYGYDIEVKNNEPKYQDTLTSEISRIIDYINSSNIL